MGWRNGTFASVLLVAFGAALWGAEVNSNQNLGFVLLWGAVFVLGHLNARDPAPEPLVGAGERTG